MPVMTDGEKAKLTEQKERESVRPIDQDPLYMQLSARYDELDKECGRLRADLRLSRGLADELERENNRLARAAVAGALTFAVTEPAETQKAALLGLLKAANRYHTDRVWDTARDETQIKFRVGSQWVVAFIFRADGSLVEMREGIDKSEL